MNKLLKWSVVPLLGIIVWMSFPSEPGDAYLAEVRAEIESRKTYLKTAEESPFNQFNAAYKDPQYFEIDPSYRVNARVERLEKRTLVQLGNSAGEKQTYQKFAWLTFQLQNTPQKLLVLKPYGLGSVDLYFLAFSDATSGATTYGGGRYLDIEIGKSNKVVLDFNLAYNPYCAYVDDFVCPLPPPENILDVSIEAGEKSFDH